MISFEINNVAKIEKAKIDLAGVTVVAGFNGTGKSTIAKSVFCTLNSKKDILRKIYNDQSHEIEQLLEDWLKSGDVKWKDSENYYSASEELSELIIDYYYEDKREKAEDIELDISSIIETYCVENELEILNIKDVIDNILGVLSRNVKEYVPFFVDQYFKAVFHKQINHFWESKDAIIKYVTVKENSLFDTEIVFNDNEILLLTCSTTSQIENAIYIETYSALDFCENIGRRRFSWSAPAINIPTQELVNSIKAENELSFSESKQLAENKKIVALIMEQVTHGQLRQTKKGQMEFVDNESNAKIEFSNMSAGLKIFALIQRLLENYSLKKSDVLIVDEPEVNLHPKWQVILAEVMVRISKELGIYILINSHSPYFIRAIEVKMAEYECADKANFYYMKECGDKFIAENVNGNLEVIYKALYEPLEDL